MGGSRSDVHQFSFNQKPDSSCVHFSHSVLEGSERNQLGNVPTPISPLLASNQSLFSLPSAAETIAGRSFCSYGTTRNTNSTLFGTFANLVCRIIKETNATSKNSCGMCRMSKSMCTVTKIKALVHFVLFYPKIKHLSNTTQLK